MSPAQEVTELEIQTWKVYSVVDEAFLAGEIRETSQQKILKQLATLNSLEWIGLDYFLSRVPQTRTFKQSLFVTEYCYNPNVYSAINLKNIKCKIPVLHFNRCRNWIQNGSVTCFDFCYLILNIQLIHRLKLNFNVSNIILHSIQLISDLFRHFFNVAKISSQFKILQFCFTNDHLLGSTCWTNYFLILKIISITGSFYQLAPAEIRCSLQ